MAIGPVNRNVPLMTFLVIVLFVAISSTAFWNFNGVYFTDIGGSSTLFGLAIAIDAVGEIPLYFLAAPIFRRFGLQRALLFTFVCSTIRVFAYAFISNPRVAVWIELSNGISWTLFWVAAVEYVNQLVKPEWRATGQALLNAACFGAGTILGILWNGFLLDYFKLHFINHWVPLAIQKVCFTSGLLLAALTVVSAIYFKIVRQQAFVLAGVGGCAPQAQGDCPEYISLADRKE
jgi:MFS family permease